VKKERIGICMEKKESVRKDEIKGATVLKTM